VPVQRRVPRPRLPGPGPGRLRRQGLRRPRHGGLDDRGGLDDGGGSHERLGLADLGLDALLGCTGCCAALVTTATLLGHGLRLLLRRRDDHDHVAAVLLGRGLHDAELGDVLRQSLEQAVAQFGTGLLPTAEHDRHLDLVATLEEPLDVALLGAVVVRVDLRAELDLLDDRVDLVLARFACLHGGFVLELAEVHELGNRRLGHRCHLDEVKVCLRGEAQSVLDAHDADLLAVRADQPHLGNPDAVVDAWLADVLLLRSRSLR
jgi:hypothetical protein